MANVQYYDVILKPVITEKSMAGMADKKYTFYVHTDANKTMIKEAVEKMFDGVKVKSVNTLNLDGKTRRRGRVEGKTAEHLCGFRVPPQCLPLRCRRRCAGGKWLYGWNPLQL